MVCFLSTFWGDVADGLYFYEGSDPPDVTDGKPAYNIIANNVIDTATEGLKMADTVGNEFIYNVRLVQLVTTALLIDPPFL